jgi:shikimate kinase
MAYIVLICNIIMNIYLVGFMGCGKSYYSKILSREVMMPAFDMDNIIEDLEGVDIYELFFEKGEEYFRQVENQVLQDLIKINKGYLIACGGGTPCFYNNMEMMNQKGATIYLKASPTYLFNRLKNSQTSRPLIAMMDNVELKQFIEKTLADREPFYKQATQIIDVEKITLPTFIQTVHRCLNKP